MTLQRISKHYLRAAVALTLAGGSTIGASVALAQQSPTGLEEVVVTATRRETNLQQTPIAVSAVDELLIKQVSPQTISDLAAYVPNFSASKITGFNAASFAMRGVGNSDIIVYNEAPVAVLVDDFVMPSVQTQLLDAFDVQEVEVLRGPQGTLFGKNTTGGAVVVHTKKPVLGEYSAETRFQVGSPDVNLRNAQGAFNIPLFSDTLALRVVASKETVPGFMKNGASNTFVTGYPQYNGTWTGDGSRAGGTDVFSARAKVLWKPMDNLTALFQYEQVRDRSDTPAAVNETPTNSVAGSSSPYFVFALLGLTHPGTSSDPLNNAGVSNRQGYLIDMQNGHHVDTDGMYLNVDWDVGPGAISWVSGYRSQDSSLASDYTGIVGPLSPFDANRSDRRKTWQEEVRFASKASGPVNYVVGAFTQHDDTKFCVAQLIGLADLFGSPLLPGLAAGGYNNNPQVLCNAQVARSSALFAEGTWKATDALTVTLGARYTNEKKDWVGRTKVFVQQLDSTTGAIDPAFDYKALGSLMAAADFTKFPYGVVRDSHSWSEPTYRLGVSYQINPDVFSYFMFSHGFKAGGYNDQAGTASTPITADERRPTNPEKADSFEVGIKSEVLDHRVRINEAVFYVKYKDAIRQVVAPVINALGNPDEETVFRNAAGLTVYGIENELTAKLTDKLTLRLPASYQHCKYDEFHSDGAGYDLTSAPVSRCPEWTATVNLSYAQPFESGASLVLNGSANYQSKNLNTLSFAIADEWARTYLDARTLIDASVTYNAPNDRWFLRALGRNLSDKRYHIAGQNVDPLWIWGLYGEPRTFGLELGAKFGGGK